MEDKNIIVYGGAFDPPTVAHETIIADLFKNAKTRIDSNGEKVELRIFVTDNDEKSYTADLANRMNMVNLVVSGIVKTLGYDNVPYAIERQDKRMYDYLSGRDMLNKNTTLVLGADEWGDLFVGHNWSHPAELRGILQFLVYLRMGERGKYRMPSGGALDNVTKGKLFVPTVSSTAIREEFIKNPFAAPLGINPAVREYIVHTGLYGQLQAEKYLKEQKEFIDGYSSKEFPKPSVTATVIIHDRTHILLVRRANFPYKGYWCFPGGFAEPYEDIEEVGLREVKEETMVELNPYSSLHDVKVKQVGVFTPLDPRFSEEKGTWGYDVGLSVDVTNLGVSGIVKGGDDAAEARWFEIEEVKTMPLAFHHKQILDKFLETFHPLPETTALL